MVFGLSFTEYNESGSATDVMIENNYFGRSVDGGFYSLAMSAPYSPLRDVLIRNNSSPQAFIVTSAAGFENVRMVGNVAPSAPHLCQAGIVYVDNVWSGATCGPSDRDSGRS